MIIFPKDFSSEEGRKKVDIMKIIATAKGYSVETIEKDRNQHLNFKDGSPFYLAASMLLENFDISYKKMEKTEEIQEENDTEDLVKSLSHLCDTCKNDPKECCSETRRVASDVIPEITEKYKDYVVECGDYSKKSKRGRKKNESK
jgi:hypothetical protein